MTLVNKTLVSIAMGLALTACGGSGSNEGLQSELFWRNFYNVY